MRVQFGFWSVLLAVLSAVLLFAACGDDDDNDDTADDDAAPNDDDDASGDDDVADDDDGAPNYSCEPRAPVAPTKNFFTDISDASGMREDNYYEDPPAGIQRNDHARVQCADIDGDGYDDLVMHMLFLNPENGVPFENLIFHNNGDGTFDQVSDETGLRDVQAAFFAFGDVDNDGDQDLFAGVDIYQYEDYRNEIYLNDGAGHFTRLADSGVNETEVTFAANAVFADFNNDANLDLFVGNGGTVSAVNDFLYLGNGDGTFRDVSERLEDVPRQMANGSLACDYDNDGDQDIFVSTYGVSSHHVANHLWENDGTAHFTNVAVERGFASLPTGNYLLSSTGYGLDPEPGVGPGEYVGSNGFGIDCADVNNDGNIAIFLTTISHPVSSDYSRQWSDPTQLLINGGAAADYAFVNEFLARGLPFNEGDVDGAAADFDNDGLLDLSLSRDKKYETSYFRWDQKGWMGLMRQLPDGTFESLGEVSGLNDPDDDVWYRAKSTSNNIWLDIDHDGDLDLFTGAGDLGGGRPNFLFRNDLGQDNRRLDVRLAGDGVHVNRDAIGARVYLESAEVTLLQEKKSSKGIYNSEGTRVLHFGLGEMGCDYRLRVVWPDGTEAEFIGTRDFGDDMTVAIEYPDLIEVVE